ncbi:MAG: hypothetical protein PHI66_00490 [Candidatus Pacebacteria bacterium]|nr:hypothetical protein [Candidatus Paceibacterota bacterium]
MKAFILCFIPFAQAHMGDDHYGHPMMDGYNGFYNMMNGYGGFGGEIVMFLFWILVIAGIIYLARYLVQSAKGAQQNETALDILKERYARGEIDMTIVNQIAVISAMMN